MLEMVYCVDARILQIIKIDIGCLILKSFI